MGDPSRRWCLSRWPITVNGPVEKRPRNGGPMCSKFANHFGHICEKIMEIARTRSEMFHSRIPKLVGTSADCHNFFHGAGLLRRSCAHGVPIVRKSQLWPLQPLDEGGRDGFSKRFPQADVERAARHPRMGKQQSSLMCASSASIERRHSAHCPKHYRRRFHWERDLWCSSLRSCVDALPKGVKWSGTIRPPTTVHVMMVANQPNPPSVWRLSPARVLGRTRGRNCHRRPWCCLEVK